MTCVDCGSPSETIISGEDLEFDALLYDEFSQLCRTWKKNYSSLLRSTPLPLTHF